MRGRQQQLQRGTRVGPLLSTATKETVPGQNIGARLGLELDTLCFELDEAVFKSKTHFVTFREE